MQKIDFPVSAVKLESLYQKMEELEIFEEDLEEKFVRGSGSGGQKINKTSNTVWIKHLKTNLEIKCGQTRSRSLNRYYARVRLVEKLDELINQEKSKKQQAIEKIRRQKRKRSKRAKEKVLHDKKRQSEKKTSRLKPMVD